jgi:hypothetical protein
MANVINKGWKYGTPAEAIGSPEDEPATDVESQQSLISLLKAILQTGALIPAMLVNQNIAPRLTDLEARMKALEDKVP